MVKILNEHEAKAVYDAMAALNNVCAVAHVRILKEDVVVHVKEFMTNEVDVWRGDHIGNCVDGTVERYASQADFAAAYQIK